MSMSSAAKDRVRPRSLPPFRADHVGSLLRPRELAEARASHKAGTLSADALRAVEDRCIAAAIRRQEEVGLRAALLHHESHPLQAGQKENAGMFPSRRL